MTWNYRVIRTTSGNKKWLGLHEVYYDGKKVRTWTEEPIIIVDEDEGVEGILKSLAMMTNDVERSKADIINGDKEPDATI